MARENLIWQDFGPCTIYRSGEFMGNFYKLDCRAAKVAFGKYAQYESAVFVQFLAKGKRVWREFVQTYKPSVVILPGVGHFEPDSLFHNPVKAAGGQVTVEQGLYRSFDDRWQLDFDSKLEIYCSEKNIVPVFDARNHNTYNRLRETPSASA